jgi:hypothetical protein
MTKTNESTRNARKPAGEDDSGLPENGLPVKEESRDTGSDGLFLVRGLLAAAALLGSLARFILHWVGLTGLVALLRLIRRILLCHCCSPNHQQDALYARATVLM